jgi:hypothetical protein
LVVSKAFQRISRIPTILVTRKTSVVPKEFNQESWVSNAIERFGDYGPGSVRADEMCLSEQPCRRRLDLELTPLSKKTLGRDQNRGKRPLNLNTWAQ